MSKSTHHENRTIKSSDVWLTPKEIIDALGVFDLDPCHLPDGERPWDTAKVHYDEQQDGLSSPWFGRVFCNPPYGRKQKLWAKKMVAHNNGILLVAARTETHTFHEIWKHANATLFPSRRIQFRKPDGLLPEVSAPGFPVAIAAFGEDNVKALIDSGLEGALVLGVKWLSAAKAEVTQ